MGLDSVGSEDLLVSICRQQRLSKCVFSQGTVNFVGSVLLFQT